MSDGPHKSLNLKRHWRKLAERADISAYDASEVCESMEVALKSDFQKEVSNTTLKELKEIADDAISSLFSDHKQRLQALSSKTQPEPLQNLLIECLKYQLDRKKAGNHNPLTTAIQDAIDIHCSRHNRQIEEHYFRKGKRADGDNIKERLDQAKQALNLQTLTRDILEPSRAPSSKVAKKSDLDEGISI